MKFGKIEFVHMTQQLVNKHQEYNLSKEQVKKVLHLPQKQAAQELGVSVNSTLFAECLTLLLALRKFFASLNMGKWPYHLRRASSRQYDEQEEEAQAKSIKHHFQQLAHSFTTTAPSPQQQLEQQQQLYNQQEYIGKIQLLAFRPIECVQAKDAPVIVKPIAHRQQRQMLVNQHATTMLVQ